MSTTEDRLVLPPVDTSVALVPQRVVSAERVALKREHKRAEKARRAHDRLVNERDIDQRIIAGLESSIRRWSALHAAAEASRHRWQLATWVTVVLALGYVLVYTHVGR